MDKLFIRFKVLMASEVVMNVLRDSTQTSAELLPPALRTDSSAKSSDSLSLSCLVDELVNSLPVVIK